MTDQEKFDFLYAQVMGLTTVARALVLSHPNRVQLAQSIDASLKDTDALFDSQP